MFVKASLAAAAVIGAAVLLISLDFRELYNEMYPVNGLRRDVLGLCHEAKPAFIRAVRRDRESCYDSMPQSVELAIGWVGASSRLAAMRKPPTAIELAERLMAKDAATRRFAIGGPRQFAGYLTMQPGALQAAAMQTEMARRCTDAATGLPAVDAMAGLWSGLPPGLPPGLPSEQMVRRIAGGGDATLAAGALGEIGLVPRRGRPDLARDQLLPMLQLGELAPARVATSGTAGAAAALSAPLPAVDLPDNGLRDSGLGASGASPRALPAGCRIAA